MQGKLSHLEWGKWGSEVPQSTAKRGWMKHYPPTHNPDTEQGPDAAGATRKTRRAPLRRGALEIYCGSPRGRRAGRAAAPSAVWALVRGVRFPPAEAPPLWPRADGQP